MIGIREIYADEIADAVKELCIETNINLPKDLECLILQNVNNETNSLSKSIMKDLYENIQAAKDMQIPICQDTGMAVVFAEIGTDVHINGDFEKAVNEGVRRGYKEGFLRCSVVLDPIKRVNSDDNTPAIIHTKLVTGNKIKITCAPKGFGSENMSRMKMFNPSATKDDIIDFVTESVVIAGANPCPPVVVGVGIGGDFEKCAYLAKKALCRDVSIKNENSFYSDMEQEMLDRINDTGIGPQGFGGNTTALAVMIEAYATHIAGLPVAVNMGCHVTRHKTIYI